MGLNARRPFIAALRRKITLLSSSIGEAIGPNWHRRRQMGGKGFVLSLKPIQTFKLGGTIDELTRFPGRRPKETESRPWGTREDKRF